LLAVVLFGGCVVEGGGGRTEPLGGPFRTLIVVRTLSTPPAGGDGPARVEIGWRGPDGAVQPVRLARPATAFLAWGQAAVAVDDERTLWLARDEAPPERIGRDATGALTTSSDATLLAWVTQPTVLGEIRVREASGAERTIARELQSAGSLRFSPDGASVLFRGARLGGVAGLFVADVGDARVRCLSNCELRAGRPWGDRFVAGPGSADELVFDGDRVSWLAPDGQRVVRRWRRGAP